LSRDGGTWDGLSPFIFFCVIFISNPSDGALGPTWENGFRPCAFSVAVFAAGANRFPFIALDFLGPAGQATLF
jgi:hypothetical protein